VKSKTELTCIDCDAPIEAPVGGIAICDDCLSTRGSRCPEFGAFDLTENAAPPREYASSPCSAHLFEEADAVRHDPAARRFETAAGDDVIDITHTFVPNRSGAGNTPARPPPKYHAFPCPLLTLKRNRKRN